MWPSRARVSRCSPTSRSSTKLRCAAKASTAEVVARSHAGRRLFGGKEIAGSCTCGEGEAEEEASSELKLGNVATPLLDTARLDDSEIIDRGAE